MYLLLNDAVTLGRGILFYNSHDKRPGTINLPSREKHVCLCLFYAQEKYADFIFRKYTNTSIILRKVNEIHTESQR